MRNAIGGSWIYALVLTFMAIFIAYVTIQMNYSSAYRLKTDMVTIIEEYDGFNSLSIAKINGLMKNEGYIGKGACHDTLGSMVYGVNLDDAHPYNPHKTPGRYSYCISRTKKNGVEAGGEKISQDKYYYTIEVFFKFNLPVLGDLYDFRVNGATDIVYYPNDPYCWTSFESCVV